MRKMFAFLAIMMSLAILAPAGRAQQDKSKRPSPPAAADCKFHDGKTVHVDYSSPRMKGRKIFGDLVPYGKVWRAGANEATTFVTDTNLTVGGKDVPAGSYTLFTVPAQDKWTLVISKKTGEWGEPYPGEADRFCARGHESVAASFARREFHDFLRPRRRVVHAAPRLGNDARFHRRR